MEQFIRYLYEYQQGQPSRNVGFVKVERSEEQTTVHIHGKGLQLGRETELKLYIFFEERKNLTGIFQGMITNINPAVNYRLTFGGEDTGKPENYPKIQGIIMRAESGRHFAAVWSDHPVHVEEMSEWEEPERIPLTMTEAVRQRVAEDISEQKHYAERQNAAGQEKHAGRGGIPEQMTHAGRRGAAERANPARQEDIPEQANPTGREDIPEQAKRAGWEDAAEQANPAEREDIPEQVNPAGREDAAAQENRPGRKDAAEQVTHAGGENTAVREDAAERKNRKKREDTAEQKYRTEQEFTEEVDVYITPRKRQCKKISRQDIAMLPRCEWRLANNSFLLHGCYNYHYLMLIEEGDELWLGVPGLYHSREARAADAFGFPRFVPLGEIDMEPGEEDGDSGEKFGYWCRKVRKMNQFSL
ncbi:MAG: hypothetical protein HFH12_01685 [Dorea sp.]|nr:hypothetical protein [Dorea sp.]